MIPALIVPVLNRYELLGSLRWSVDRSVGRMVVIDNGGMCPEAEGACVVRLPHNIGVAASWNLGMKLTPKAPWWLIVNSDIAFGPGDLERLEDAVEPRANAVYYLLGMAAFAVTLETVRAVGYFDENFHPAYDEDLDWQRRARLVGTAEVEVGFTGTHVGSATIYADDALRYVNGITHPANDRYYHDKWGGPKQGGERFARPFDTASHVGTWRLDPARLRDQAWPRRNGQGDLE